jgi:nucleotide-binding universal stress UspA family protein
MPSPIIAGVALRDDDSVPLALAQALARLTGAPLALVTSYTYGAPPPLVASERLAAMRERAELALGRPATGPSDDEVLTYVRPGVSAAHALLDVAVELDAAAIVVGTSHRGRVLRVLAGSVTTGLLHGAPCPVAVAPRGYVGGPAGLRRIGVGFVQHARRARGADRRERACTRSRRERGGQRDGADRVVACLGHPRMERPAGGGGRARAPGAADWCDRERAGARGSALLGRGARGRPRSDLVRAVSRPRLSRVRIARIRSRALGHPRQRFTRTGPLGRMPSARRAPPARQRRDKTVAQPRGMIARRQDKLTASPARRRRARRRGSTREAARTSRRAER